MITFKRLILDCTYFEHYCSNNEQKKKFTSKI